MNNPLIVTVATVFLIALSAFCVIIEFALLGARRHRLEAKASASRSARAALRGAHELTIMLAIAQLGITACTFALGAITKPTVDKWLGPVIASWGVPEWAADSAAFALSLLFATFLHLVVGEMAPKSWAIAHPERSAMLIGIPSRALAWPFRPLLTWINNVANRLVAASGATPVDRAAVGGQDADTIRHLVEHSASSGTLDAAYHAQLSDILKLEQLVVEELIPLHTTPTPRCPLTRRSATCRRLPGGRLTCASSSKAPTDVRRGSFTSATSCSNRSTARSQHSLAPH